ncbi:hypothetical protein A6R68_24064 [Neotoma lepida]|uniref:Conserved oligomeric Golgi complex subunit 6 n=1 Tax=Neotoma lepida TaxID=56216 RepID=A0A1A6HUM9_NEOLE|nr:hypothetical protein A6R68_24064 [Neotoma lepida]
MADGSGEVAAVPASGPANGLSNGAGATPAQPNNPLSRKLHKILETRLDNDKEMLEALKALSTFFVENSLRTRRNLRGDIERRSLAINEEFVSIFKEITFPSTSASLKSIQILSTSVFQHHVCGENSERAPLIKVAHEPRNISADYVGLSSSLPFVLSAIPFV